MRRASAGAVPLMTPSLGQMSALWRIVSARRAARVLCPMHYKRLQRLGDPTTGWIPAEQAATQCATCNLDLKSYRSTQRFCSVKCRNAWHTAHAKET